MRSLYLSVLAGVLALGMFAAMPSQAHAQRRFFVNPVYGSPLYSNPYGGSAFTYSNPSYRWAAYGPWTRCLRTDCCKAESRTPD